MSNLDHNKLFGGANQANNSLVHLSEVSPVLDRVVSRHDTRCHHEQSTNIRVDPQSRTCAHHDASEGNLVQIVIQNLPQRTTVVRSTRLFAINCIDRLIQELGEPCKQKNPMWKRLRESWIQYTDCDQQCQGYN